MSTATQFESIDMTRPKVPMSRLVQVELRKLVNTRSSFWLVISMAIVAALIMAGC